MKPLWQRLESYKKQKAMVNQGFTHYLKMTYPPLEEQGQKHWKAYGSILSVGDDKHYGYYEIRPADTVSQYIKHTGWHCDSFGNETCFGLVITLSRDKFAAGFANSNEFDRKTHSGSFCIAVDGIFDEEYEAAREGDRMAERYAEEAKEEDAKFQAEKKIEEIRDDFQVRRKERHLEWLALHAFITDKENPLTTAMKMKTILQKKIAEERERIQNRWQEIRALRADPWSAVLD